MTCDLSGQAVGGSYVLVEPIGGGATGTVWRALDRSDGSYVAVKLLREDLMQRPKAVSRFLQERTILLLLRHRHIVRVRDLLTAGSSLGLAMDLVDGGSLRGHLDERGTLAPTEAARLLSQVASALAEAHRHGIVHRDLKPDNILLDKTGTRPHTRLTDFGIARVLAEPGMTTPEVLVGTPYYMAPEIVYGGRTSPAVDVYALGVVLYELIAGRQPYAGGSPITVLRQHVDSTPPAVDGFPQPAWRVVEACMDRRPACRPTAAELVTTFRSLARETVGVPPLAAPAGADSHTTLLPARAGSGPIGPGRPATDAEAGPRIPRQRAWETARLTVVLAALATLSFVVPGWDLRDGDGPGGTQSPTRPPAAAGPAPPGAGTAPPTAPVADAAPGPDGGSPSDPPRPVGGGAPSAGVDVRLPAADAKVEVDGPWRCDESYTWDLGHPVLAKPCYALGARVRLLGRMQALPGVQADVTITLSDELTGAIVSGPHECRGLMFTDLVPEHNCGPFAAVPARGRSYRVVQKWQYTGRGLLPGGNVRSYQFTW